MLFLSSVLLANGIYSNSVPSSAQGNEAKVKTDIKEQENKCAKDTECENENKLDNKLILTNDEKQFEGNIPQNPEDNNEGLM